MRNRSPWTRASLVIAVLAAVAVRFLTPAGWMPNLQTPGGPTFVICSADGEQLTYSPDLPTHAPKPEIGHDHCLFCGFATVGGSDLAALASPPVRYAAGAGQTLASQTAWHTPERYRRQAPRGPPAQI